MRELAKLARNAWKSRVGELLMGTVALSRACEAFVMFQTHGIELMKNDNSCDIPSTHFEDSAAFTAVIRSSLAEIKGHIGKLKEDIVAAFDNTSPGWTVTDHLKHVREKAHELGTIFSDKDHDIAAIVCEFIMAVSLAGATVDLYTAVKATVDTKTAAKDTFPRHTIGRIVGLEVAKTAAVGSRPRALNETLAMFFGADRLNNGK